MTLGCGSNWNGSSPRERLTDRDLIHACPSSEAWQVVLPELDFGSVMMTSSHGRKWGRVEGRGRWECMCLARSWFWTHRMMAPGRTGMGLCPVNHTLTSTAEPPTLMAEIPEDSETLAWILLGQLVILYLAKMESRLPCPPSTHHKDCCIRKRGHEARSIVFSTDIHRGQYCHLYHPCIQTSGAGSPFNHSLWRASPTPFDSFYIYWAPAICEPPLENKNWSD